MMSKQYKSCEQFELSDFVNMTSAEKIALIKKLHDITESSPPGIEGYLKICDELKNATKSSKRRKKEEPTNN